ncbi:MAG: hypothetical protein KA002_00885 [Firmicutes bacterium]|nr:hypothetical protein [Bacillota bacterium]
MEGTTVGQPQGPRRTEAHLEQEFVELMRSQRHMAVVFCSSHNLDRIVTIYRAAKRTGKIMVIDLHTAYTLMALRPISKAIPQWNRDEIRVVSWDYHQDRLRRAGRSDFVEQTRPKWVEWDDMKAAPRKIVLLAKSNRYTPGQLEDECGTAIRDMSIVWSMWDGYWKEDKYIRPLCETHGVEPVHLHISGHCTWYDIRRLAAGLRPGRIIPIHTEHAEHFARYLQGVTLLQDGEALEL